MTPQEIITAAKRKYNAVGDDFFTDAECLELIYQAHLELAQEALLIENVFETTVTSGQREYAIPTNSIAIKRVEYDGREVMPASQTESYRQSLATSVVTVQGQPTVFYQFNDTIVLTPAPDNSTSTLKVYCYTEPQAITISSTLEIPSLFHMDTTLFMLAEMHAKDKDFQGAQLYLERWEKAVQKAKRYAKKQRRGAGFASVQVDEW